MGKLLDSSHCITHYRLGRAHRSFQTTACESQLYQNGLGPRVAKISRSSARIASVFGRSSAAILVIPGQSVLDAARV